MEILFIKLLVTIAISFFFYIALKNTVEYYKQTVLFKRFDKKSEIILTRAIYAWTSFVFLVVFNVLLNNY